MEYSLEQDSRYSFDTPTTPLIPPVNNLKKEMAAYAALLSSSTPEQIYQQSISDMENTGRSQYVDSIVGLINADDKVQRKQAMVSIINDESLSKQDKYNALTYYEQNKDIPPSLRDKYVQKVASVYDNAPLDPNAFAKGYFDTEIAIANKQAQLNKTAANWDDDTWGAIGGVLIEAFPFVGTTLKGVQYTEAIDAVQNKDRPAVKKIWDVFVNGILQGSAAEELRANIDRLPTAEQKAQAVKKVLQVIEKLPGTDFNRWTFVMGGLEGDQANWEKYLYNGLGLLGAAYGARTVAGVAGKLTKSGVSQIQVNPKSVVGSTAAHNPTVAGTMTGKAILDETGQIASALGTNKSQLVGSMLPKVDKEVADALGPEFNQKVHDIINALDEEGKYTLSLSERAGILYTDEAKSALARLITDRIANTQSAALHLGKSSVQFAEELGEVTEYGAKGVATFGKTSDSFFDTFDEALATAKQLSGELPEGAVTVAKVDKQTGKLITATKGDTSPGEYYLQYTWNRNLRPEDIAIFGPDAVRVKFDLFGRESQLLSDIFTKIAKSGKIGGWLFAHQMIPKSATDVAFSSFDKALRMEDQYLGYARQFIAKQSSGNRKIIAQLLEEGEKFQEGAQLGKVFTWDEVVQKAMATGKTSKEAEEIASGYFVYRRLSDWMYTMLDRQKSLEFNQGGFKWFGEGESRFVGKSISEADALKDVRSILNKLNNTVEQLTPKAIKELYESGGSIVRLGSHYRNGDEIVEYAKAEKGIITSDIKQGALPYVKGWVPRFYNNNYFVTRTPKSVVLNGVKITDPETLKNYRTSHYASDNYIGAELKKNDLAKIDSTGVYDIKPERTDVKSMFTIANDIARIGMVNSARRGIEAVPGGTLTDPLEGLMRVIQSTSKTSAMSDFFRASKEDFVRQYGSFLTERGVFPSSKQGLRLKPNASLGEISEFKNALTVYNWLEGMTMMQRYDSAVWKNVMYGAGEFAEKIAPIFGSALRKLGDNYPVDTLRKASSTLFISLRPARQILLQPSQLMLMASIQPSLLNPLNAYRLARDIGALNLSHLYKSVNNKVMPASFIEAYGSKVMGISKEEYIKQIEQLKSSGLLQSVDMNTLLDGLYAQHGKKLLTTKLEDVTGAVGGTVKGVTLNYGRSIGFDRGEQWNLIGHWIVARNRFQRMNPSVDIYSRQATEQIAADTREMTFSMTRPGSFAYQRNAFALPLQFIAAPHKAILNFTTSKVWTPAEKARLMASSFILYGSAGVGMLGVMDNLRKEFGTSLTPDQWKLLEGGVLDWGVNYTINSLFDEKNEKTELDIARSFSPGTNLPFTDFLTNLSEKPFQEVILGPSWNLIDPNKGRLARAIRDIALINKRDPITSDNFKDSMYRAIEVASGGTDWMKYRLAKNLHWTVTTNGALIDERATLGEAMGALLGIQPSRARVFFEANKFIDQQNKEIEDTANHLHDSLLAVSRKYGEEPDQFTNAVNNLNAYLSFEPDENISKAVTLHFNRLSKKMVQSTEESLHTNVYNNAQYRSREQQIELFNYLKSVGQDDAANRIKALIGEE